MYLIRNAFIFTLWVIACWLVLNRQPLWMTLALILLLASWGCRWILDLHDEVAPMAGTSRFTRLSMMTALTIAHVARDKAGSTGNRIVDRTVNDSEEGDTP